MCISQDGYSHSSTFSSLDDTEIPALRGWCTRTSTEVRDAAIDHFFERVTVFYKEVITHMTDVESVNEEDCRTLQEMWETKETN